jgi:hypothetical protein
LVIAAGAAQGATFTWDGGGDGTSFGTTQGGANLNWSGDVTPSAADIITINPSATTTVNFNTAIYSNGSVPRSISISNSGAGKTTMSASASFYILGSYAELPVTIGSGGEWIQTAGTFSLGSFNNTTALDVRNGGAVIVNNGATMSALNGKYFRIGATGNGSLTVDAGGSISAGSPYLQIGSGTTGNGTVNFSGTSLTTRQVDIQNGTMTIASGAGTVSTTVIVNGITPYQIGTSTGTAVLNKNNAGNLYADNQGSTTEFLRVGPNGTVNWADGGTSSSESDNNIINGGVFNFTRATGESLFRFGPLLQNTGTFNWTGAAGLNINSGGGTLGSSDFQNDGRLVLSSAAQRTLTGDLILGSGGTLAVTLGSGSTGLRVAGSSGGGITINGTLEISNLASLSASTTYNILTTTRSGGITYNSLALPTIGGKWAEMVDNGVTDGTFTIRIVQQQAVLGAVTVTNPASAIITGGTANFTYTVANSALSGGASLSFTGAGASNVAGSSSGSVEAASTSTSVSGLYFNGTSTGQGRTGTFTVSAPNASGTTSTTGTVSVDVYDHASGSATGATIALADSIVGYTGSLTGLTSATISNAAGYRVNLMTTGGTSAGFVNINNVSGIASGSTGLISAAASLNGTQTVGSNSLGQSFSLTYADDSALAGASSNLGSQSITVTGNVLDHATPGFLATGITNAYTQDVLNINFGSIDETAGLQSFTYNLLNLASETYGAGLTAGLDFTGVTADGNGFASGLTTFNNLLGGGTSSLFTLTFNPTGQGTFNKSFTLSFSDNRNLAGNVARRDLTINAAVIVVPEPGTLALAGIGIAAAAYFLRRRRA